MENIEVKVKKSSWIEKGKLKAGIKSVISSDNFGLIIALMLMTMVFSSTSPHFFTGRNIVNILIAASLTGLVAVGESYLIIAGLIDLSPGSVAAFASVLAAVLLNMNMSFGLTMVLVILAGILIGVGNAIAVNKLEIEPFIATLASMSIVRGLAFILCNGQPVFIRNKTFLKFGKERILDIPIPVLVLISVFVIFGVILSKTRFGRNIYIIGGNKTAARLAGLSPKRITLYLYMIIGALSALGGAILAARMTSGQPSAAVGLEFDAITAAVLGGTAFTGGVGTMFGTVIGVLILQGFNNGLLILNVPVFWQYVARGLLLLLALSFDYIRRQNRKKALLKSAKL
jgi:ribose transport system permease protein